ncbi:MAG: hypothetical protein MMC23_000561 [Stictis urceolatum]|nr:hypothetical protein [Stictis urceolata]
MAGGHLKYRHLNRSSAHRQALLKNLVASLFEHESITTTWPKAKEAQRLAEKLITLGKKNTNASRNSAERYFFKPTELMPKLFGPLRERYLERPGGYTRVLRIEPHKDDQAPSAILELVDGPRDMRFAITAKAMLKERDSDTGLRDYTLRNIRKVTRYRANGEQELEDMADRLARMEISEERRQKGILKRKVYPDRRMQLNPGSKDGDED